MPPKSTKSEVPPVSTGSRRSTRLSAQPPSTGPKAGDKRVADAAPKSGTKKSDPASKKAKTASTANGNPDGAGEAEGKKVEKEKQAEAPASAKPSTGGSKTLKTGDKLPSIKLKTNDDKEVDVSGLAGEKGVVLFLYPKADTPGCTTQACGFRDAFDDIAKLGYDVYGLSKDTVQAQQKWHDKKTLNYKLLSDPQSQLIKRLGAFVEPNNTKRSHFIFEKGSGKLVDAQLGVKPADDPKNCLQFVKQHHK